MPLPPVRHFSEMSNCGLKVMSKKGVLHNYHIYMCIYMNVAHIYMYGRHLKKKALFSHSLFETEASHGL